MGRLGGWVVFVPLLLFSCARDRLVAALPPDIRVDAYAQEAASKVDILWVVDNSNSMADKQANLGRNFKSFIELFSQGGIDFRMAVTTTDIFKDAGQLKGSPKVLTPTTPGLAAAFAANIKVGVGGSAYEAGLEAARMALGRVVEQNRPKLEAVEKCRQGCGTQPDSLSCQASCVSRYPVDFIRPDAFLYLIFVTDDEDKSTQEVRYYWRTFENTQGLGNDATVMSAAIVGMQQNNPCGATVGGRYLALTALTDGEVGDICDPEFSRTLRLLSTNAVGLRRKFVLTLPPNETTIEAFVRYRCDVRNEVLAPCESVSRTECDGAAVGFRGIVCTPKKGGAEGWSYDAAQRVVYFSGESVPGLNSQVELHYYPEGTDP